MKKIIFILSLLLINVCLFAQGNDVQMADKFRSEGKIYVVVTVVLVILIGLFLYLIRLDRKISRLEKDQS